MRSLTKIVLRNVQFRCNEIWYVQSDGLAMGGSLAVKLANAWIKLFEASLQKPEFKKLSLNLIKAEVARTATGDGISEEKE